MRGGIELWTNLAYLIGAALVYADAPLMALALVVVGLASGLYHTTGRRWARLADRAGVLLLLVAGIVTAGMAPASIGVVLALLGVLAAVRLREIDVLVTLLAGLLLGYTWPVSIGPLMLFALATTAAYLAEPYRDAAARALRYDLLHGAWHVLTAAAAVWWTLTLQT